MAEFKCLSPATEVMGGVISVYIAGFPAGTETLGKGMIGKHGFNGVKPENWYHLQPFLDALKEISDQIDPHILTRMGSHIARSAALPPGLDTLEKCMEMMDTAYHMNHRGGDVGNYKWTDLGTQGGLRRAKMVVTNCYSCAIDRGTLTGFAERFKPPDAIEVLIRHDDTQPCRAKGGDSCTYLLSW